MNMLCKLLDIRFSQFVDTRRYAKTFKKLLVQKF